MPVSLTAQNAVSCCRRLPLAGCECVNSVGNLLTRICSVAYRLRHQRALGNVRSPINTGQSAVSLYRFSYIRLGFVAISRAVSVLAKTSLLANKPHTRIKF